VSNSPRSRTFELCKNYADEVRLVLPSLMDRERLEEAVSKLSLYLACCSRLAQQMERLLETSTKTIELQREVLNSKNEVISNFKKLLKLEQSAVGDLMDDKRRLIEERDEVRKEVCYWYGLENHTSSKDHASKRGWDCFKENDNG
jgi:CRISPR/Cas system-associated exonuclease Cas4 (RecB family)